MAHVPLKPIGNPRKSVVDDRTFAGHGRDLAGLSERLSALRAEARAGWGETTSSASTRRASSPRASGSPAASIPAPATFEVGTFVNYGEMFPGDQKSPGAGVVTAFARIEGRWCMVIANDNTVASGAWWPRTPEKIQRAQMMALRAAHPDDLPRRLQRPVPARAVEAAFRARAAPATSSR